MNAPRRSSDGPPRTSPALAGAATKLVADLGTREAGNAAESPSSAPGAPRSEASGGGTGIRLRAELPKALCAALLASVIGAWAMALWRATPHIPFTYESDAIFNLIAVKTILLHGWYLTNPELGAPLGQQLYDFPAFSGDSLYLLAIKGLGIFSRDPALVTNAFYLLGFPLVASVAYLVLRKLRISAGVAIAIATLYAVLPARFDNSEIHLFLGAYFTVPVSCYLVLSILDGRELFRRDPSHRGPRAYLTPRSAGVLGVCIALGCADNYYALYTAALMGIAAVLAVLTNRRLRAFLCSAVAIGAVLAAVLLNAAPTIVYSLEHGRDTAVGQRYPAEADSYALTLTDLVLPVPEHRIPLFASVTNHYLSESGSPGHGEASYNTLGVVGTIGLLFLCVSLAASCIAPRASRAADRRAAHAALGAGTAFLIGTVGGLSTWFAYVVNPQLRAPNRIAVFIAFFALYGAALALDALRRRLRRYSRARIAAAAALPAVLVLGALDQTTPAMIPNYAANAAEYRSDAAYVRAIERRVPPNAEIFQLPIDPFPEGSKAYGEASIYLVSKRLRWSFGAMTGRPEGWAYKLLGMPLPELLQRVSAVGFSGISFDASLLPSTDSQMVLQLSRELGAPLVSPDGSQYFFDMTSFNRDLRAHTQPGLVAKLGAETLG